MIVRPDLVARVPKHLGQPGALLREGVHVVHVRGRRGPGDAAGRVGVARGDFGQPDGLVGRVAGAEFLQLGDRGGRGGHVDVDVVGGEEGLAVAGLEELRDPVGQGVRGDGGDEFGACAGRFEERLDGGGGVLRGHGRREAPVRVVGFVEGEEPVGRVVAVHQVHGRGDVAGEGHHGNVSRARFAGRGARDVEPEGEPGLGGPDGVEHADVVASVERDGLQTGGASAGAGVASARVVRG